VYEFRLPDLGEGIHEGEILAWHVSPGDVIEEDAPLGAEALDDGDSSLISQIAAEEEASKN